MTADATDAPAVAQDASTTPDGASGPDVPAAPTDGASAPDVPPVQTDGAMTDAVVTTDAGPGPDVPPASDATADVGAAADAPPVRDAAPGIDVPAPRDAGPATDVPAPRDAGPATDVPAPRDAGPATDVPAPADAGCTVTARVAAPTADEVIETCSASNGAVFYDFRVEASGPVMMMQPRWRTPDGDLAPSPDLTRTDAPWVFRRLVGGPSSGAPALGVFPNALRGTWRFEVRVVDRCGRETLVSQPFQLTFTNRRCPNP
ncbi:MAG: hypothetical protein U0325_26960 [Polyangiales bacterium]